MITFMIPTPIYHSYWVLPNQFLAGEYPRDLDEHTSQDKIAALIQAGVRAFIDLTGDDDGLLPYSQLLEAHTPNGVTYQRFPIRDLSIPHSAEYTHAILDTIDAQLEQGRTVYVHCWGGVGRTGVIVGCWLARHGYAGQASLDRLHELWRQCPKSAYRQSPETRQQEQYVLDFAASEQAARRKD
jgi:hypothetical protein